MATEDLGLFWESAEYVYQSLVHLVCCALEEPATTSQEQCVTCNVKDAKRDSAVLNFFLNQKIADIIFNSWNFGTALH